MDYRDPLVLRKELKGGNELAFDYFFRVYYTELCRFAYTFVNDYMVAEDIVQNVFMKVWTSRETIDETQSVESYFFVAVRNSCYTYLKSQKDRLALGELELAEAAMPGSRETESEELQILRKLIEELPLQCKVIFKLVVWEEMKYHEVAARLEISVNTVKTQMKIAYKLLRGKIKPYRSLFLIYFFTRYLFHSFKSRRC